MIKIKAKEIAITMSVKCSKERQKKKIQLQKAKWIEQGEKSSQYFLRLKKTSGIKCYSLYSK